METIKELHSTFKEWVKEAWNYTGIVDMEGGIMYRHFILQDEAELEDCVFKNDYHGFLKIFHKTQKMRNDFFSKN